MTTVASTPVINGRFRIALDGSCKPAINANPDVYVELLDGTTSLGRSKIGAVPYAVEADHAVSAANAAFAADAGHASMADNATNAANCAVFTDWQSYSPVVTGVTASQHTTTGKWRRVGDSMEIRIQTVLTSTVISSGGWLWSLPNGYSTDVSKLNSNGGGLGHGVYGFFLEQRWHCGQKTWRTMQEALEYFFNPGMVTGWRGNGQTYSTGDNFDLTVTLPIVGWTYNK